jgi:cell division protein FtsN
MSSHHEEEFELVLGNKQLLSLFFLVVVLFGVFFSFGYTVGFSRGEKSAEAATPKAEPVEEASNEVRLPDTLLQEAPKPSEPTESPKPAGSEIAAKIQPSEAPPPVKKTEAPKPPPPPVAEKKPEPKPTSTKPAAPPPAKPASSSPGQSVAQKAHLQIAAVRVRNDAEAYVGQLKGKGHAATLSDKGDGWFRVLVGPFDSAEAAKKYQEKLKQDGISSLMRYN